MSNKSPIQVFHDLLENPNTKWEIYYDNTLLSGKLNGVSAILDAGFSAYISSVEVDERCAFMNSELIVQYFKKAGISFPKNPAGSFHQKGFPRWQEAIRE